MTETNALLAQAMAAADKLEDQTQVTTGGDYEYETPPEGFTPARFIGYIEMGKRKQQPYQGKAKPDADEVRLEFELNGPKHQKEIGEGDDKRTITNRIAVRVTKKLNDRAGFTKLFKKMLYGRDGITHMAQMLGEGFLIQIVHNTSEKDGKKKTYANMKDTDGNWLIQAPRVVDPLTNEGKDVPVPEATQPLKLLLWDAPTKEMWESIFIDGTRTVKGENGQEREVSKNWLQEDIVQNAVNFDGSPLQAIVGGLGELNLEPEADPVIDAGDSTPETPSEAPTAAPTDPAPAPAPEADKPAADAPAAPAARDPLADLGLT